MFERIEEGEQLNFVKNENGEIVQKEENKSHHDEDTAEPFINSEQAVCEDEVDKRYQRFLGMTT